MGVGPQQGAPTQQVDAPGHAAAQARKGLEGTGIEGQRAVVPGHGQAGKNLLKEYGEFMAGIYEPCLKAVKDGQPVDVARAAVLKDPRVAKRAATMDGFESNIGKYVSLAYLEAEKEAF